MKMSVNGMDTMFIARLVEVYREFDASMQLDDQQSVGEVWVLYLYFI